MGLDRFAATWREAYVTSEEASQNARDEGECVFCSLLLQGVGPESGILWRDEHSFIVLNAFPYGSGHLLALPSRHVGSFSDINVVEYTALALAQRRMVAALEIAYRPDGINVGANLGRAAGAGIPKHLHVHALPRWSGDTNFMTTIGETRVLSESLDATWNKVAAALNTVGPDGASVD